MANQKQLSATYEDIEIVYDEGENVWRFTLRGRERSADSLARAKEAIDKPVPADKAKAFQREKAICIEYNGKAIFGEVTSIADTPSYRSSAVWFVAENGERSKKAVSDLRADTPRNRELVDESKALEKEADGLRRKAEAKRRQMTNLKIEVPE